MSQTVIKVENLYKEYKLGVINHGYLIRDLQSWWAMVRGKEDPNSLLSVHHGENAKTGSFLALKDISFEVKEGDRLGIIGKNGAGKSTLLKIFSRITAPTKGTVSIRGRVGSLLEVGTGFHPELTGRENIYLKCQLMGMKDHEIKKAEQSIIDFAEIGEYIDQPTRTYSSGMLARLGFAVNVNTDPEIFIVDEALATGDSRFQQKCFERVQEIIEQDNVTLLFVTHATGTAAKFCERGLVMKSGKITFDGPIDEAAELYEGGSY